MGRPAYRYMAAEQYEEEFFDSHDSTVTLFNDERAYRLHQARWRPS